MKGRAGTAALVLAAVLVWLYPALAGACPTCATREGAGSWGLVLVGAMIALPFVVAGVTIKVVRKLTRGVFLVKDLISWGLPRDVSEHGYRVDWLLASTSVFVIIMFAATLVWIVWAAIFHGRKHRAHYDLGDARRQVIKAGLLSAVIFLVVDGNLFVNGLRDLDQAFWNFPAAEAHPGAVRIQINAHQWAWDARYPGPDGKFNTRDDIVTLNDLRVPVGVPVLLQLAATDVLHSFSLPNFRIKQDAVPGTINRLWFQAKETGRFEIACAQHCGVGHYKMRGLLTVLDAPSYARWAGEASALSAESFDPADAGARWGWDWQRANKVSN